MPNSEAHQIKKVSVIGGFFILLVVFFTLSRFYSNQRKIDSANSLKPEEATEVIQQEKMLSVGQAQEKIRNRQIDAIIDLRDAESFKIEHLLDSRNIPLNELDNTLGGLDPTKNYFVLDDGKKTDQLNVAAKIFQNHNFSNVYFLTGGFIAWKNQMAMTISVGDPNSFSDQAKVSYLNSDQLKDLMGKDNNLFILDVRKNDAFLESHLKNAINIPLDDLENKRAQVPSGKKIIVYDKDGFWAFQASVRLNDMGHFNVFTLSDGFDGWTQKKYEVVK